MLENKPREQTTVADKSVFPIVDYEMSVRDYVVRPAANGLSGAITITLPPVGKAIGKFYSIVCRNADAVNTVTIEDNNNDSECWNGDYVMNGKCDAMLFYSDGMFWHPANNDLAIHAGTTPTPTTLAPTTIATTLAPTTVITTAAPTTVVTTAAPTTIVTTLAPTTLAPTTIVTTVAPTTL